MINGALDKEMEQIINSNKNIFYIFKEIINIFINFEFISPSLVQLKNHILATAEETYMNKLYNLATLAGHF